MLIGYTFDEQLFTSEAFRKFQDTFLNKNSGVIDGCSVSKTNTTVTVSDGWFVIKGALLREQGGTTLNVEQDGYYSLVCEIDLTKENTETSLLQATIKLIRGASTYPTLNQQDITNGGSVYQYEFARFRSSNSVISDFIDKRTYLNFQSIYTKINTDVQAIIDTLEGKIKNVEDGSAYLLKTGGKINGNLEVTNQITCSNITNSSRSKSYI